MKKEIIVEKAFQVAEIQVTYKPKVKAANRPRIGCSSDASKILHQQWDINKIDLIEQFKVILLNWGARVLGIYEVAAGNMHTTVVDIKLIMAAALKGRAASLILAHNHPSGDPIPSFADRELTKRIKKMAKVLDIQVYDHIILCRDGYFSFADEGLLKPG